MNKPSADRQDDSFASGMLSIASVGTPPAPANHVRRERLFALLDNKLPITSVVAAGGFGKTSIVSGWLAESANAGSAAWVTMNDTSTDPFLLLAQLVAAVRMSWPEGCEVALSLIAARPARDPATILRSILNELEQSGERWTIILDDYPAVQGEIDSLVGFCGDSLPPTVSLVIISRGEASLPLARWRVKQKLTEIGIDDLRFTATESGEFIRNTMNLPLDDQAIASVDQSCDGWVAGLQLAALWLRKDGREVGKSSLDSIGFDGEHRFVSDYMAADILGDLDEETRRFLVSTSVVDRFNASLCDALLESSASRQMLAELRRRGLFLIALDGRNQWFRYHQLFRDFLRSHVDGPEATDLHRRASAWFDASGLAGDAIRHAQLAGDDSRSVEIIRKYVDQELSSGNFHQLSHWLDLLSDETIRSDPELSGFKAWILYLKGNLGKAEAYSIESTSDSEAATNLKSGTLMTLKAFLELNRGRAEQAINAASAAADSFGESPSFFSSLSLMLLGSAQRISGDRSKAMNSLWRAIRFAEKHDNKIVRLEAISELVPLMLAAGKLRDAAQLCEQAITEVSRNEHYLLSTSHLQLRFGNILYELNELERAEATLEHGIALCQKLGIVSYRYVGKRAMARVAFAKGEASRARELLAEAAQAADRSEQPRRRRMIEAVEADFLLREGNVQAASGRLAYLNELTQESGDFEQIVNIRLMLALGRPRVADSLLARMETSARCDHRMGSLVTILMLRAVSSEARGEAAVAERLAIEALSLAGPAGYVRLIVDLGEPVLGILTKVASKSPYARQYVDLLTGKSEQDAKATAAGVLTGTEHSVLQLVALGMSNRDIAAKLNISVGTTKWHVHHIYEKLDVPSRTAAVRRAREMRLLADV